MVASIALATDTLLYGIAIPVLPRLLSARDASESLVGLSFAAYAIALVLATPLCGRWLDRAGARAPMLWGLIALAGATVLFALVSSPGLLVLARALQGAAAGVTWTASLALIAATHPPQKRAQAMGLALSATGVGVLAGPLLGGVLADWLGLRAPFLLAAGVAAADAVARWLLVRDGECRAQRQRPPKARGRREIALVAGLTALGAGLLSFMEPILPIELERSFGAGPATVGILFGVAAAVAAAAAIAERRAIPDYGSMYALYNLAYAAGLAGGPAAAGIAADVLGFGTATAVAAVAATVAGLSASMATRDVR